MRRGPNCSHTLKALLSPDSAGAEAGDARRGPRQYVGWSTERFGVASRLLCDFTQRERVETKRGNGAQGMYGAQGSDLFPLWISERSRARNIGSPYRRLCPVKWLRPAEASLTEFQNDYQ